MWPFHNRTNKIPRVNERVVILGASRGLGLAIAHEYALAGAKLCLVARREDMLANAVEECKELRAKSSSTPKDEDAIFSMKADFVVVDDMLALRTKIQEAWGGLDTLVICAAALTLKPMLELAGVEARGRKFTPEQADKAGLDGVVEIATNVARANYVGPLLAAATFIPMLTASPAPAIMLMSSLGALVPAPTLSVYGSTKAGALLLFQALAIEHPYITFTLVAPAPVRGEGFFVDAVGGGAARMDMRTYGLAPDVVARRSVRAVDAGEGVVFIPGAKARFAHFMYWIYPSFIARTVSKMYSWKVEGY